MCGITGFWGASSANGEVARAMAGCIKTRGPDDAGVWLDEPSGLALAHRRLAILDLSPAGHQPMISDCGRYVLSYNGEIYNHLELRGELEQSGAVSSWHGHSDTETLLSAIRCWGIEGALKRLNGMFAFALWDREEKTLFLARDRMGEKPLYYGRSGDVFLFGSELKALEAHPKWLGEVDRDALTLYLRHNYIPAPHTIYHGIHKLPPAHYAVIRAGGREVGEPISYWDLLAVSEIGVSEPFCDERLLVDELDTLLRDAVKLRMASDVPLGAFLSGGYDSSTVAALMQAQSSQPVKTFTIGFYEDGYNEATHAKAVAEHLGTEHTELYVTPEEAMAVIPKLPTIYDEPFSDSSQIPTYLVSQLAREHVTVSLSGDGGDELFYGYDRYFKTAQIWGKLERIPRSLRAIMSQLLKHAPASLLEQSSGLLPKKYRLEHLADRLPKIAEILSHSSGVDFYRHMVSHAKKPASLVLGGNEPDTVLNQQKKQPQLGDLRELMMYLDMVSYLPGDILAKVDRASMAVSLEARVPLLDHRIVEFAWRVPMQFKYRDSHGKWLLRQVLYRYLPKELMERPKMGFGVPIEHWLRGPLREWADELLDERRLQQQGYFDPKPIVKMWREHRSGKRRWHYYLWDILMFQAWLESAGG